MMDTLSEADSRRNFIKGSVALAGASGLFALGVSEKVIRFLGGPKQDLEAEALILQKKLQRLQQTADERALEIERRKQDLIRVAAYSELEPRKGKYFIAYNMAPGLAFVTEDGKPMVRSAKCTHLGCTVGGEVDEQGRVLCPCHISYFDIRTGEPHDGAPAKLPLPELPWALLDGSGQVVMRHISQQSSDPLPAPEVLAECSLYIMKPAGEA